VVSASPCLLKVSQHSPAGLPWRKGGRSDGAAAAAAAAAAVAADVVERVCIEGEHATVAGITANLCCSTFLLLFLARVRVQFPVVWYEWQEEWCFFLFLLFLLLVLGQ